LGLSPGAGLFRDKGCFACHRLYETGETAGPDLTHVGARLSYDTITRVLTDPASVNPEATMPPPPLSADEREELGRFLAAMK
jgi:cbb3-type cytochrome oxidase cytochrome c subunit